MEPQILFQAQIFHIELGPRGKMNEHANVEHSEAAKFQCRHCGRRFGNTQSVREVFDCQF